MKYVVFAVVALFVTGCANDNQVTIQNIASGSVFINFRAKTYALVSGESTVITEIPNGTYDYNTTYQIPTSGLKGEADGDAASGELIFEEKSTKINFVYSSFQTDSTYHLGCTRSSTRSLSTSTSAVTSP
jgi:hypothetical protein